MGSRSQEPDGVGCPPHRHAQRDGVWGTLWGDVWGCEGGYKVYTLTPELVDLTCPLPVLLLDIRSLVLALIQ